MIVYHYDAFSSKVNKGNPAGVVLEGHLLSDEEMQRLAFKVGFNETAYVTDSQVADFRLRYFTPGHETSLCGHATIATIFAMKERNLINTSDSLRVETNVGIIPIGVTEENNEIRISMGQAPAEFLEFDGSVADLAAAMGVETTDIDDSLPIVYGSTGSWTLLVPIKKLSTFTKMIPDNKSFPSILKARQRASIHPFCLETYSKEAQMHGRHFSSPYSGTIEDAVTGTASAVMGAYYAKYITNKEQVSILVEQGQEIDKDGQVFVNVKLENMSYSVSISGTATYVGEMNINY